MRLTAENKEKIRARILKGAADLFRKEGVEAVNIDKIMQSAGLTRGAFYAHFKSKGALFAEVLRREHPVRQMLADRDGQDAETLWQQALGIFHDYLLPEHLVQIRVGCSFAALTGDAGRSPEAARTGYGTAWQEVLDEMERGQGAVDRRALQSALVLATGGVATASAMGAAEQQAELLHDVRATFDRIMATARLPTA